MFKCKRHGHDCSSRQSWLVLHSVANAQCRRQDLKTTVCKLLYAGWIPHFRVYAWGCFYLSTGIDVVGHSVPSKIPRPGPCLQDCASADDRSCLPFPMRAICAARLSVVSWLHFLADRPQEGRHFSRDRGDRDGLVLPREDHCSVARAEAELTFPRYFANGSG